MITTTWRDWSCTVRVSVDVDRGLPVATTLVRDLMDRVGDAVDRFRDDSDLARVNRAAGRLVPVSALTVELVDAALEARRRSAGAVDPTLGAQVLAAGYDRDIEAVRTAPPATAGAAPEVTTGGADVHVDHALRRVGVARGVRLDLGATAKAVTVQRAADLVAARLGRDCLVEIGGDLAVAGPGEVAWNVQVAETAGGPGPVVALRHGALATSSTLARRWHRGGTDAHHLIDPATGRPARGPWRTATVWAPTALQANTWSTAAVVRDHRVVPVGSDGVAVRLVGQDGRVTTLGPWPTPSVPEAVAA